MRGRSGLTLVEVLAALVVLTLFAGSCLPLLRRAVTVIEPGPQEIDMAALAEIADELATSTGRGAEPPRSIEPGLNGESVVVERLTAVVAADHAWVLVECGRLSSARWEKVEPPPDAAGRAETTPP